MLALPLSHQEHTHFMFSGSFSLIFSSTLISSRAASLYFSTFLMILRATRAPPLKQEESARSPLSWVRETVPCKKDFLTQPHPVQHSLPPPLLKPELAVFKGGPPKPVPFPSLQTALRFPPTPLQHMETPDGDCPDQQRNTGNQETHFHSRLPR